MARNILADVVTTCRAGWQTAEAGKLTTNVQASREYGSIVSQSQWSVACKLRVSKLSTQSLQEYVPTFNSKSYLYH